MAQTYELIEPEGLACPRCLESGGESRAYELGVRSEGSALHPLQFYDKLGELHVHNPSQRWQEHACSLGHRWEVALSPVRCASCAWPETG